MEADYIYTVGLSYSLQLKLFHFSAALGMIICCAVMPSNKTVFSSRPQSTKTSKYYWNSSSCLPWNEFAANCFPGKQPGCVKQEILVPHRATGETKLGTMISLLEIHSPFQQQIYSIDPCRSAEKSGGWKGMIHPLTSLSPLRGPRLKFRNVVLLDNS